MGIKEEYGRIFSVIESDRRNEVADCGELIRSDLEAVLRQYFDLTERAEVKIVTERGAYRISVLAKAGRIKPVGMLPQETPRF